MNALRSSFAEALANLRSNFLQTFLSMLGIIIGVGALVAMLSLIDGLEEVAREQLSSKTALENMAISANTRREIDGVWVDRDTAAQFDEKFMLELLDQLDQPAKAQLSVGGTALATARDTQTIGLTYRATTFPVIDRDFELVAGRWPAAVGAGDSETKPVEALINYQLALKLISPDTTAANAVGRHFTLEGGTLEVVGVAEKSDDIDRNGALFQYDQLNKLPKAKHGGGQILLAFHSVEDVLPAQRVLEHWLEQKFAGIEDAVSIQTYTEYLKGLEQGFLVFRLVMGFLIGIAVVVGGVGIMNVLVMSVVERTSEIGIRKALGANRRSIISQFLSEAIALSVIGSCLGTLLGMGVAMLGAPIVSAFTNEIEFSAVFTLNSLLIVALVAVGIGCLFGTYPALKASKLDPVTAIRRL